MGGGGNYFQQPKSWLRLSMCVKGWFINFWALTSFFALAMRELMSSVYVKLGAIKSWPQQRKPSQKIEEKKKNFVCKSQISALPLVHTSYMQFETTKNPKSPLNKFSNSLRRLSLLSPSDSTNSLTNLNVGLHAWSGLVDLDGPLQSKQVKFGDKIRLWSESSYLKGDDGLNGGYVVS